VGDALTVTIDGTPRVLPIRPDDNLLDLLRREGVTSVKRGCGEGYCGACAILVDGRLLNACRLLAPQVEGCTITTAAGIGTVFHPHPIQRALVEEGAVQCGFCTPGWVVATKSLLDDIPNPTYEEICAAMDGNLCRCTGYVKPLAAIERAADSLRREA
jgi:aerobic-type carbon monoxide dehydrogenase small subunit (CoxS/CutS family)